MPRYQFIRVLLPGRDPHQVRLVPPICGHRMIESDRKAQRVARAAVIVTPMNALANDQFDRFVPDVVASGNCFPNNDPVSQADMGCD